MPTVVAALDPTQYKLVANAGSALLLQSHRDTVRVVFSLLKPAKGNTAFHELGGTARETMLPIRHAQLPVWALPVSDRASLSITDLESILETSERGEQAQKVYLQDQTSDNLSLPFVIERAAVTLAVPTVVDSRDVTLSPGHGALVGEELELAELTTNRFMQAEILAVVGDVITLDQPVNRVYATDASVVRSSKDLLVDGSLTTQIFSIKPLPQQAGDIVRIILEIRSEDDMDFSTFGGAIPLVNGCVLRVKRSDGTYKNLFNFKSNSDFFQQGFDFEFVLPKTGNTVKGFTSRVTWGGQNKQGTVIRLDGTLGEELQLLIQDDLRPITRNNLRFRLIAQGHEIQG